MLYAVGVIVCVPAEIPDVVPAFQFHATLLTPFSLTELLTPTVKPSVLKDCKAVVSVYSAATSLG